ncbi:hypothetical protein Bca4012_097987 [Brassica carinata]
MTDPCRGFLQPSVPRTLSQRWLPFLRICQRSPEEHTPLFSLVSSPSTSSAREPEREGEVSRR